MRTRTAGRASVAVVLVTVGSQLAWVPWTAAQTGSPAISAEHPMSEPVTVPNPADQSAPAIATDGRTSLVVWQDGRNGGYDVYGARIDGDGRLLDPAGIPITRHAVDDGVPAVAWDGTNYLVVWERGSLDRYGNSTPYDIYGARVSPQGSVLEPDGIAISTAPGSQRSPAVAFNGAEYLVTWTDGSRIAGSRIATDGRVVDPSELTIGEGGAPHHSEVDSNGSDFLVVWDDQRPDGSYVYGARMAASGQLEDPTPIPLSAGSASSPAVAWDGTIHLVVWEDFRSQTDTDLYGIRVGSDGTPTDPAPFLVAGTRDNERAPSLVGSGTRVFVVWSAAPHDYPTPATPTTDPVLGLRVSGGAPVEAAPIRVGTGSNPAVALNGGQYQAVWDLLPFVIPGSYPPGPSDVYGARVTTTGAVLDAPPILVVPAVEAQAGPAGAWNGVTYLMTCGIADRSANPFAGRKTLMARVDGGGVALDGTGSILPGFDDTKVMASDGRGFLIVWSSSYNIVGLRVDAAGHPMDASPFLISEPGRQGAKLRPALASDGSAYFVIWEQYDLVANETHVVGTRVVSGGAPVPGPWITLSPAGRDSGQPALAWTGDEYLAVWLQGPAGSGPPKSRGSGVVAVRLSPAGAASKQPATTVAEAGTHELRNPAVAAGRSVSLVTWDDFGEGYGIPVSSYGARLNIRGRVLDSTPIALLDRSPDDRDPPRLAFDGTSFLLVRGADADIVARRVGEGGALPDNGWFTVAGTPDRESQPALVPGPFGHVALSYVRAASEAPYDGAPRVFLRFIDDR